MKDLPGSARGVWYVTVAAGLAALVAALVGVRGERFDVLAAGVLLAGGIAANFFTLRLPSSAREHHRQETTVASAVYVSSLLLFPPGVAVVVTALGYGVAWAIRPGERPWFKSLFNLCAFVLSVGVPSLVWHAGTLESDALVSLERVLWLALTILTYFVVNTGLVSLMVASAQDLPFSHVWGLSNRNTLTAYFATICVGVLLANLWIAAPWALLLAIVPLVSIHFAFKSTIKLEEQTLAALFQLAEIIDQRDSYTHKHSLRVGEFAEKLAVELGLSGDDAYLIYLAGRLHDIGKCAVSNEVLHKPGPLDPAERAHMSSHPLAGGAMLQHFAMFKGVAQSVRGHHERWDGGGYPDGLAGLDIPMGARVIAVADAYDAMTTTRPYRLALPNDEAERRLRAGRGTQWDPEAVDAFLRLLNRQPLRPASAPAPHAAERAVQSAT